MFRIQPPVESKLTQTNRILLVEDEDLIREMVVIALEEEGFEVHTATNGREALNMLQNPNLNETKLAPD